jgi:hypothetical protein
MMPGWSEADYDRLIWDMDPIALANALPAPAASWAGAVQQEIQRFSLSPAMKLPEVPRPAYLRCAAVTMIKDEADIIHANLAWLFSLGIRRFVVMDNMSTDGTADEVRRFSADHADSDLVLLHDPVVAHFQAQKVTVMARLAARRWPDVDWILPVDADEFCIAVRGFDVLDSVPRDIDALTIPKAVHFLDPTTIQEDGNGSPFARMPMRSKLFCVPPKIIARASQGLSVEQGNHKCLAPHGFPTRYAGGFAFGFYHREFQTRSFTQFLRKIRNGGTAILAARAAGTEVGGDHWMDWYRLLSEQGEAAVRRRYLMECCRDTAGHCVQDPFDPIAAIARA